MKRRLMHCQNNKLNQVSVHWVHTFDKNNMILNLNIGILGHVDSGKTTLAKCLSAVASTACFDKNPQSQERCITLDLGFSACECDLPSHLRQEHSTKYTKLQFTFVDCPGHAKLIRTVIGGAQIMDLFILVIDVTKGIQTQTAECLVIGGLTCNRMIVALNKIDLVEAEKRDKTVDKMVKRISKTLAETPFRDAPIVPISATSNINLIEFMNVCRQHAFVPERDSKLPFIFAVDHCFSIKGQGTICTGTVLQGAVKINDAVEIPALKEVKKVKSIQMFRQPLTRAEQGDRIGIAITQFDAKLLERGLISTPNYVIHLPVAIVKVNRIKYYKGDIGSKTKFHVSVGHSTLMASILLFKGGETSEDFDCNDDYEYVPVLEDSCDGNEETVFALLEFEKLAIVAPNSLVVASKLDMDVHTNHCRLAFWGRLHIPKDTYTTKDAFLANLKIFKEKSKEGRIQRIINAQEIIVDQLFKRNSNRQMFVGLKVSLSSGERGVIDSTFGSTTKVKVRLIDALEPEMIDQYKNQRVDIKVILKFKKFLFKNNTKIFQ